MANIHQGDVGTRIKINCGEDISAATMIKIVFKRPGEAPFLVVTPTLSDATSVTYITQEGDIPEEGSYQVQVYYRDAEWRGYSTTGSFPADRRIYDVTKDLE